MPPELKQLINWLESEADKTSTYPERVAYHNTIRHIKDTYATN